MLFITTFFLQTLLLYIYNMPFKISQGKGNNARPRIIAGENTINIVAETGVSKSTVNLMKRQVNLNYTKKIRRETISNSIINPQYHPFETPFSPTRMCLTRSKLFQKYWVIFWLLYNT